MRATRSGAALVVDRVHSSVLGKSWNRACVHLAVHIVVRAV